jgi:Raf kinase inhibitor-like YbhB/YbcL family protein
MCYHRSTMTFRRILLLAAGAALFGVGCDRANTNFTVSNPERGTIQTPPANAPSDVAEQAPAGPLMLSSTAFLDGGNIPEKYTCNGQDFSPPVAFGNVPPKSVSLALIMEDADMTPSYTHWLLYNMPVTTSGILDGDIPPGAVGQTTDGRLGYAGPCPPQGTHRYVMTLYALDAPLQVENGATKDEVLKVMEGHILQKTTLMGKYGK